MRTKWKKTRPSGKNVLRKREKARDLFGLHKGIKVKGISSDEAPRENLFWEIEEGDI